LIHFFKPKPFLCDLIPNDHIDIHSHLLPGIDDGATSLEDTVTLIEGLKQLGIEKFITTPHIMGEVWKNTRSQVEEKLKTTVSEIEIPNIKDNFKAAAEYMIDAEFKELFSNGKLLTLKENFVLVEISYLNPPIQLFDTLFELQLAGYQPVLAHPERYPFYHHSINNYKKLKKAGCFFQLNMLSVTGYYGERVAKISEILLKERLIDFIGSDVHHSRHLEQLQKKIVLKNGDYLSPIFQNNAIFNF
jgi:tyrosine-protein phosphatase YwqE